MRVTPAGRARDCAPGPAWPPERRLAPARGGAAGRGEPPRLALRDRPAGPTSSRARARLPRLPGARARPVAQHPGARTGPTCSSSGSIWPRAAPRADRGHADARRLPRRARRGAAGGRRVAAATLQRKTPACARSTATCAARSVVEHDPTAELRAPREPAAAPGARRARSHGCSSSRGGRDPQRCATGPCSSHVRVRPARVGGDRPGGGRRRPRAGLLRARGKGSKERLVPIGRRRCRPRALAARAGGRSWWARASSRAAVRQPPRRPASPARACTRSSSATRGPPGLRAG